AALPVLFRALETSTSGEVRERVQPAADRLAAQHPGVVAELLASEDDAVAVGAARSAGRLRLEGVTAALVRLLDRVEPPTRLAAVAALVAMGSVPSL
ncbi:MAG: hypothetical protein GWN71_31380, partial [Gammaproteobacteria bacterium]|nr:hypothetical protein [Gemmatimonadota bacterium]NIU77894.1 hypothetical protein [Gammaproteobacteria bacterium]